MSNNLLDLLPDTDGAPLPGLVINGKFLQPSTARSGVYRVAREMLIALDGVLTRNPALAAAMPCRLLVPGGLAPETLAELGLQSIRTERRGHGRTLGPKASRMAALAWEQLVLPWRARGSTLISLCNIGPVVHRNAFTLVHDAQVYSAPESYSRAFRNWYRLVLPLLGWGNRSLLSVSQYSRKQLAHFGVARAGRIRVIHNGVDHVLRLEPDVAQVTAASNEGRPYVLALSNIQPHKNVQVLMKAFASPALRDVTLALFGPAKREDFEAQGCRVPPNVRFLGFVSDEELAGLMQHAAALAFPSTTEGFGLPPLEAMLLECPAVVAPCGALPEVCGDAVLWAGPNAPAEWVEQILRLCSDRALRSQMQARGRKHAAQFTWHRAACRLLETVLGHSLAETDLMQPQAAHAAHAEGSLQREPQAAPALRRGLS